MPAERSAFVRTAEQEAFVSALADLLERHAAARACYEGGARLDRALWRRLVDIGAAGVGLTQASGGSGGGFVDQVLVAEQIGRFLAPVPFLSSTVIAGSYLALCRPPDVRSVGQRLAGGSGVVVGILGSATRSILATADAGRWRLTGRTELVIDGAEADLLILPAFDAGRAILVQVDPKATGVTVTDQPTVDRTRGLATIDFEDTSALQLASIAPGDLALVEQRAAVALAAEATGAASTALTLSADYARDRRQFGRPIGTFQAVKHRVADMLVDTENARSATWFGAWALDGCWPEAALAAATAKAVACENAVRVVGSAIQVHGGIGCTWDHDLHLYLRRVKGCEHLAGNPGDHWDRIAETLLGPPVNVEAP